MSAKNWKCDICNNVGPWTDDWQYWGSYQSLDEYGREGIVVTCSDACRKALKAPKQILRQRGVRI